MHSARVWQVMFVVMVALSPAVVSDVAAGATPGRAPSVAAECPNGHVALTFDDGPDPVTTPQLVAALRAHDSRATFFMVGADAQAHPDVVVRARAAGMEVGNHTYDHPFLDEQTERQVTDELTTTTAILTGMGGPAPTLFRPPYGRSSAVVERVAERLGLTLVLWSRDSDDYEEATPEAMLAQAEKASDGEILLYHDRFQSTVDAVPRILEVLAGRGLCAGRVLPSSTPRMAYLDYDGPDKTYFHAVAGPW
ncbi:polysaccharide deacetylase family protein [Pseudonocardia sp.]|uniref:polysaccharide deacetylase family protein n=2 Tax=Pseudonocardia sp. TaxID=60912 RepID=UPI003D103EF9